MVPWLLAGVMFPTLSTETLGAAIQGMPAMSTGQANSERSEVHIHVHVYTSTKAHL